MLRRRAGSDLLPPDKRPGAGQRDRPSADCGVGELGVTAPPRPPLRPAAGRDTGHVGADVQQARAVVRRTSSRGAMSSRSSRCPAHTGQEQAQQGSGGLAETAS